MLKAFSHPDAGATGVYVVAWDAAGCSARARMFAGDVGVAEDAATGSAALAYGVWLVASGLLADSSAYEVVQGVEMGRPSTLSCSVDVVEGRASAVQVSAAGSPQSPTAGSPHPLRVDHARNVDQPTGRGTSGTSRVMHDSAAQRAG